MKLLLFFLKQLFFFLHSSKFHLCNLILSFTSCRVRVHSVFYLSFDIYCSFLSYFCLLFSFAHTESTNGLHSLWLRRGHKINCENALWCVIKTDILHKFSLFLLSVPRVTNARRACLLFVAIYFSKWSTRKRVQAKKPVKMDLHQHPSHKSCERKKHDIY